MDLRFFFTKKYFSNPLFLYLKCLNPKKCQFILSTLSILFKIYPANNENIFLEIEVEPALIGNNKPKFTVFINNTLEKAYDLNEELDLNKIALNLKKNINNVYKIDFKFSNIVSPLESLQSPDARKLGLLIKSIILKKT